MFATIPPQSIRPDISVSALPHASQAHLRDICPYYICLSSLDSWVSYIRMFCICISGDRGSYFRLFVYDRHLSTWPSADERRWQRFGIWKNGNIKIEKNREEALVWLLLKTFGLNKRYFKKLAQPFCGGGSQRRRSNSDEGGQPPKPPKPPKPPNPLRWWHAR